jgi:hypothetical protein
MGGGSSARLAGQKASRKSKLIFNQPASLHFLIVISKAVAWMSSAKYPDWRVLIL